MAQKSRKGAQPFATGNFNKGLNGVLGTINAGAQKIGKTLKKDNSHKGSRKGNITNQQAEELFGGYEDYQDFLDDVPEGKSWNYNQLKYFVEHENDLGFSIDQVDRMGSRKGSRKGGPTIDQVYDLMECISDAREVTDKYFDGYNKEFEELTPMELTSLFNDLKQRYPSEYKDYVDSTNGAYLGGRKGSRKGDVPKGEMEQFKKYGRTLSPLQYGYELVKEKYGQQVFEMLMQARQKQSFNKEAPINSVPEGTTQEQVDFWNDNVSRDRTNGYTGPERSGSRKGSGSLCDLGSVSGKGSRPETLKEISTKIALGRNRSIGAPTAVEESTAEGLDRKGSRKGFGFGYHQVVLHEISPKQITSIPGGGVVNHEGQVYKIEGLPEFEPNEWIHKLVIWTDNDPDWDYSYDYCDWE